MLIFGSWNCIIICVWYLVTRILSAHPNCIYFHNNHLSPYKFISLVFRHRLQHYLELIASIFFIETDNFSYVILYCISIKILLLFWDLLCCEYRYFFISTCYSILRLYNNGIWIFLILGIVEIFFVGNDSIWSLYQRMNDLWLLFMDWIIIFFIRLHLYILRNLINLLNLIDNDRLLILNILIWWLNHFFNIIIYPLLIFIQQVSWFLYCI